MTTFTEIVSSSASAVMDTGTASECVMGERQVHRHTAQSGGFALPHQRLSDRYRPPAVPDELVVRDRLFDVLECGNHKPLTLVCAPAGSGKTVTVASWVGSSRGPAAAAWISMAEGELCAAPLWHMVCDAIGLTESVSKVYDAKSQGLPDPDIFAALVLALERRTVPLTLVVDCDSPLTQDEATGLHRLLTAARETLRVVLISRAEPLLPLHLYRLNDTIAEIRMDDLAFPTAEAEELLSSRGARLPEDAMRIVLGRTQGWAAGLVLASMSLAGRSDVARGARDFTGSSGTVAEYLTAEVLDAQPPPIRKLLLDTSVVDVLQPGLSEALGGPAATAALRFLVRANAFLEELSERPGWYRYHPLFRELLRVQVEYESPGATARLHRAAAHWYAEHRCVRDAVRHAAAGGAWSDAAGYLVDSVAITGLLRITERDDLGAMLEEMPVDIEGVAPSLVLSVLALRHGRATTAEEHLDVALARLLTSDAEDDAARLCFALVSMVHADAVADGESLLSATQTAESLVDQMTRNGRPIQDDVEAAIFGARAQLDFLSGRWDEASAKFSRIAADHGRAGDWRANADAVGRVALIAAWRGLNRKAIHLAHEALRNLDQHRGPGNPGSLAAEIALGWVYTESYDIGRAKTHITLAEGRIEAHTDVVLRGSLLLARARLLRATGDHAQGQSVLEGFGRTNGDVPKWLTDLMDVEVAAMDLHDHMPDRAAHLVVGGPQFVRDAAEVVRAHGLLLTGSADDAPQQVSALPSLSQSKEALPTQVQRFIVGALWHLQNGDEDEAAHALDRALCLAATENLRRPFREAPPEIRRLLRSFDELAVRHAWLRAGRLPQGRPPSAPNRSGARHPSGVARSQKPSVVTDPLTDKETEVLVNLNRLLSTDEIAAEMFVTVNTVRTHVRNILRKLGVPRRNEAIRRARELGIVPPQ